MNLIWLSLRNKSPTTHIAPKNLDTPRAHVHAYRAQLPQRLSGRGPLDVRPTPPALPAGAHQAQVQDPAGGAAPEEPQPLPAGEGAERRGEGGRVRREEHAQEPTQQHVPGGARTPGDTPDRSSVLSCVHFG